MDYFNEMLKMGDEIMNAVNKAVNSNNYSNLSRDIKRQVEEEQRRRQREAASRRQSGYVSGGNYNGRVDIDLGTRGDNNAWKAQYAKQNAERQAQMSKPPEYTGNVKVTYNNNTGGRVYASNQGTYQQNNALVTTGSASRMPTNYEIDRMLPTPFIRQKPKQGGALKRIIGGALGMTVTAPVAFICLLASTINPAFAPIFWTAVMGTGFGASLWATIKGSKERKLIKNYYNYGRIVGNSEYIPLANLADGAYESVETVTKELNRMKEANLLPQARFDEQNTTLMLTDKAYAQYRAAEDERRRREKMAAAEKYGSNAQLTEEAAKIIEEGERFVKDIRSGNELIPDTTITEKLNQLEKVVSKIFVQVRKDPSVAGDLGKLMSYYLPTTQKLINAYIELDRQPEVGDNIVKTKKEISDALDSINKAFENLLDSLFEDVAWDISSDISAMKTMMTQDGLMQNKKN